MCWRGSRKVIAEDEEVERIQDGGKVQKPSRKRTTNLRRKNLAIFSTAKTWTEHKVF